MSSIFSNLSFLEKVFSMCLIRGYHYSTDCFLLKFNYSIALISPGCYTIILRLGRIKALFSISRIFKGTKYVILFNVPIILKHLFDMFVV